MSNYQFTLYNVISMPYTPPDLNVSVQYSLEHTQIAISANKEHHAPVSDSESLHCQQTPICALRLPILRVRTYPTCILALFLRNDTMIKNMCKTRIYPALSLPSVKYLAFGHWIISTSTQFNLQISCADNTLSRTQVLTTGLNFLQLENGCAANSIFS